MPESTKTPGGALHELRNAEQITRTALDAVESQNQTLKKSGMHLPSTVTDSLLAVQADLQSLEETLVDEQSELSQLRALADMSAEITTSLNIDDVLEDTMDLVLTLTRAERGYVILRDEETGELDYRISRDNSLSPATGQTPQISTTIVDDVLSSGEPLSADNAYKDERFQGGKSIVSMSLRSVLCVPLRYKDNILGVVYVDNRLQEGLFTEREKNTLKAFANTAGVAITNARLYADIQSALSEITQVKELMDNVFDSVGSGIIAADSSDTITTFNRAAEDILDIPAEETIGEMLNTVLPKLTADLSDHLRDIRQKQEAQTIEAELLTQRSGRIAVSMKLSPLRGAANQTRGVAVVLDDVTEKREREQQLRIMKTYLPPEMVDNIQTIANLALGGERREVTCLFAEVRSLSTMTDIAPKDVMDILNQYLAVATECIHETQGIVDKYMGTELMAMWNTQLSPQNNHAALAVECALLMRERFNTLYDELGITPEPPHYRIGIHTGVATLGNVGSLNRRDFTAIGDTINLSKRLEENTNYGQIIISENTRQHMTQFSSNGIIKRCTFDERPAIQVKGRQQKTRIYEVHDSHAG